jgi:hypothetical protein
MHADARISPQAPHLGPAEVAAYFHLFISGVGKSLDRGRRDQGKVVGVPAWVDGRMQAAEV